MVKTLPCFERGDHAMLTEQPDGNCADLTVGRTYEVIATIGSSVVITTDTVGKKASVWAGRLQHDLRSGSARWGE